ncbi:DUF5050 domain-containing protein [Dehalobacter restrictus]|uniref:DUF5050 domain-containing protein n=1 Tax=Dehalobacter restrictus TaxID=55583 RepID=UPI00338E07B3
MKIKRINIIFIVIIVIILFIVAGIFIWPNLQKGSTNAAYQQLVSNMSDVSDKNYVSLDEGFTNVKVADVSSAIDAVASVRDTFGMTDPKAELAGKNTDSIGGTTYYRLEQKYKGIPVYGRSIVVSADDYGTATSLTSNYTPVAGINTEPTLSVEKAQSVAENYFIEKLNCSKESISVGSPELVIYNMEGANKEAKISYVVNGFGLTNDNKLSAKELIINAENGEITNASDAAHFTQEQKTLPGQVENKTITVEHENGRYLMLSKKVNSDKETEITVSVPNNGLVDKVENSHIVSWTDDSKVNKSAVDAAANISLAYEYYYKNFGRNSFDNKGGNMNVFVNVGGYDDKYICQGWTDNAGYWQDSPIGEIFLFAVKNDHSNEYSADLDVVGHEFTHGVVAYTAGLNTNDQPNALNEAYADVMGICIESSVKDSIYSNIDWKVDNLRNLADEKKYSDFVPGGDCHINSQIISHTAYLMYSGFNAVDGIYKKSDMAINNTETLSQLWYRSLEMLQSDAAFSQCRYALELAAKQMYHEGLLSDAQVKCVSLAFDKVGINISKSPNMAVSNNPSIFVYDINKNLCTEFGIQVFRIADPFTNGGLVKVIMNKTVTKDELSKDGGYQLTLSNGVYAVYVFEKLGKSNGKRTSVSLLVDNQKNDKKSFNVYTDFGMYQPIKYGTEYNKDKGDWIYYGGNITNNLYNLFKIRSDGTGRIKLSNDYMTGIYIVDDWIYYTVAGYDKLYKMYKDGSGRTEIISGYVGNVNIVGNWIYYTNGSGGSLYKIRTDGTGKILLSNDDSYDLNIAGDWIYYVKHSPAINYLYKIRIDGTARTKLMDNVDGYNIAGDWIYLNGMGKGTEENLYKIGTDGTGYSEVCTLYPSVSDYFEVNIIKLEEEWLFFSIDLYQRMNTHSNKLYKVRIDGTGYTKLSDDDLKNVKIEGAWIYYENCNDNDSLYKIHTDGTEKTKLNSDKSLNYSVFGDWIYYCNDSDNKYLYKIRTDGTEKMKLNSDISSYINLGSD